VSRLPRDPLDADERAVAAALPRPHGRGEPDAAMDARILAAAHAAAQAPATAPRTRRWTVPLGLAASLCLALGLAWRTQLDAPHRDATPVAQAPPSPPATAAKAPMPAADDGIVVPQAKSTPMASEAMPPPIPTPRAAVVPQPVPPPVTPAAPAEPPAMLEMRPAPAMALPMPAPAAAPPPPAPPAPPPIANADAARAFASEAAPPSPRALAPAPAAAKARGANDAQQAQRAFATQADAPVEDVPPATADSPDVRNAWLRRIGELMQEGKLDLARASLAEFRRRYPDAAVPAELRLLEPPPAPDPATH
jgi:hypothetical protein